MTNYLIDVNLPYYFSYWRSAKYIHQIDLQNDADDYELWQYAKVRGMTIVTKDADFSDRILLSEPPPRVIHIRIGNAAMGDFHRIVGIIWNDVLAIGLSHRTRLSLKKSIISCTWSAKSLS